MEAAALIGMLVLLFAIVGVIIYFGLDYYRYKQLLNTEMSTTSDKLDTEKSDRLSNLKYVVDQVNAVNEDMYNTVNSNVDMVGSNVDKIASDQQTLIGNLDKFFKFSPSGSTTSPSLNIMNLPGVVNPDMNLLQHVTLTMGMTAKDLEKGVKTVEFCSKADPTKCVKIPDENGNVVLTAMENGQYVKVNSPMSTGDIYSTGIYVNSAAPSGTTTPGQRIIPVNKGLVAYAESGITVGNRMDTSLPDAALHVKSTNSATGSAFKVDVANAISSKVPLEVDNTGVVTVQLPLKLKDNAGNIVGTIDSVKMGADSNVKVLSVS